MKHFFSVFFCVFILISLCGCNNDVTDKPYRVTKNENNTYGFLVKDKNGNIILSDESLSKEPEITEISDDILSVSMQGGTGISTRWTQYCSLSDGRVSAAYFGVLGVYENKVIYPENIVGSDKIYVVIRDIFDNTEYLRVEIPSASRTTDPIIDFKFIDENLAEISYLKSDNFSEETITIELK